MKRKVLFLLVGLQLTTVPALAETAWSRSAASELLDVAERVTEEGLDPADYDTAALRAALAGTDQAVLQARASTVFLRLAGDFAQGHVRGRKRLAWHLPGPMLDDAAAEQQMASALSGGGVRATLQRLLPQHRQYQALKAALATTSPRDKAGAQRLRANLERWRWMPRDLGKRYLLVNIPAFTVSLVESNKVVSRRRTIVGKVATPTPQFGAQVTGAILNPWWDIPPSIVRESVGRLVGGAPAEARAKGYVVAGGRYRQLPGPGNALGQVKLVMPNPFSIYLHDTPNKALFDAEVRAFSHGCIRTQDITGLVEALLASTSRWDRARIDSVLAAGRPTQATLAQPLPVYVTYFTTAAEESGELATFPDIYGRDNAIIAALTDRGGATAP
jgi:L,D-transpeptidase YcbB